MHDLLPEGEDLRRAVRWVSENLKTNPDQPISSLVQQAVFKFDLSPRAADFLVGFYSKSNEEP